MDENPEAMLKGLGLTEYETRAWLALLRHGTLSAEAISEIGNIPLPRVYDTITELQHKGFVMVTKTRPKLVKPIAPDKALSSWIEQQRKTFDEKVGELKKRSTLIAGLLPQLQPAKASQKEWNIWSIEKRQSISKMLQDEAKSAKSEILSFSGDLSWLPDVAKDLKTAIRRGIRIRIVVHEPSGAKVVENIKLAKKIGAEVKIGYKGLLRGQIVDRKIAYIATKYSAGGGVNILEEGRPGLDGSKKYELIIFDNPALVDAFKQYFEFCWQAFSKKS